MKIVVLGAGVIGVTSAWYLAKAGHEVTVVDRQAGPALETSYANAGEISPGYSSPWAAPGVPLKALKWMFQRHAPLVLHASADPVRAGWMAKMLGNCTSDAYAVNKSRMMRVAEYSRDRLQALRIEAEKAQTVLVEALAGARERRVEDVSVAELPHGVPGDHAADLVVPGPRLRTARRVVQAVSACGAPGAGAAAPGGRGRTTRSPPPWAAWRPQLPAGTSPWARPTTRAGGPWRRARA